MSSRATNVVLSASLAACSSGANVPGSSADGGATDATVLETGTADASTAEGSVCTGTFAAAPWSRSAKNPLVSAGSPQADAGFTLSIADPFVLHDPDDGLYKAWWSSAIGTSFTDPGSVIVLEYAESKDGVSWSVQAEPALSSHVASGDWDYTNVETPTVVKNSAAPADRRYMLWYSGANSQVKAETQGFAWYQIGLAFSADGKHFARLPASESPYAGQDLGLGTGLDGLTFYWKDALPGVAGATDGLVADPTIVFQGGLYQLWFSSYAKVPSGADAFGISHATSSDGIHWTALKANPLGALVGGQTPTVVWNRAACFYEMWFSRDSAADKAMVPARFFSTAGYFHAISADGETWALPSPLRDFAFDPTAAAEAYGTLFGPTALLEDGGVRLYYTAWGRGSFPPGFIVPTQDPDAGAWPAGGISLDLATRQK